MAAVTGISNDKSTPETEKMRILIHIYFTKVLSLNGMDRIKNLYRDQRHLRLLALDTTKAGNNIVTRNQHTDRLIQIHFVYLNENNNSPRNLHRDLNCAMRANLLKIAKAKSLSTTIDQMTETGKE